MTQKSKPYWTATVDDKAFLVAAWTKSEARAQLKKSLGGRLPAGTKLVKQ